MSSLNCHVLDTSRSQSAANIPVQLTRLGETDRLAERLTNAKQQQQISLIRMENLF